uniref:Ubiquitin-like domain-containing protein n=1 Tax=Pyrodinium bahamense TaxID=73915 RepID=A0A7S0AJC2_9DINO|mmetsp:Transcript_36001/g.99827  ORF Transcript_36001/g.99827 Transcript_36001/m.99827 type:complete len:323 (+) Transcript_36001:49-1017(+)
MALRSALLSALAAVAAASSAGARPRTGEGDAVALVQRELSSAALPTGSPRAAFAPGDHVLVQLEDWPERSDGSSMVKGSVTGKGAKAGSYNVHLWVGPPRRREMLDVPGERLMDARAAEEAEAAKEAEREEAERKAEAERAEAERKAEAERREAERKAEVERQEAERKAEEEAKLEAARLAEEEEQARRQAEEEALARRASVHAKWEAVKAARLKDAGAEDAPLEVQQDVLRSEKFKEQLRAKAAEAHVKFVVKDPWGNEAAFDLAKKLPFNTVMGAACERLGLQKERARFSYRGKVVHPSDTIWVLDLGDHDVVMVKGPRK